MVEHSPRHPKVAGVSAEKIAPEVSVTLSFEQNFEISFEKLHFGVVDTLFQVLVF